MIAFDRIHYVFLTIMMVPVKIGFTCTQTINILYNGLSMVFTPIYIYIYMYSCWIYTFWWMHACRCIHMYILHVYIHALYTRYLFIIATKYRDLNCIISINIINTRDAPRMVYLATHIQFWFFEVNVGTHSINMEHLGYMTCWIGVFLQMILFFLWWHSDLKSLGISGS